MRFTFDLPELLEMPAWEVDTAPLSEALWQAVCAGEGTPEIDISHGCIDLS